MRVPEFQLERWQSVWEHRVDWNIAESGVEPMGLRELLDGDTATDELLGLSLGYPQTNGNDELRRRIADLYPGADADNVLVTCGGAEANFLVTWALLEPGDGFVVMQPNYLQVAGLAEGFGARVRPWWLRENRDWHADPDELEGLVDPATRIVAVCNPNNPTGSVLDEKSIGRVCDAAGRHGAWILADEIYRGAELDGKTSATFFGKHERVVCTGGLSKAYGLPGLRIGWAVGPKELIARLWAHHDYTTIGAATLSQHLATHALEPGRHDRILARTRGILTANYPRIDAWIRKHEGTLRHHAPAAGAIVWIGHPPTWSSEEIARELLERKSVLLAPGEQFGVPHHMRIGFGGNPDVLQEALTRIDEILTEKKQATAR